MTPLLICLLITILMPFLAKAPLALAMHKESRYDNKYPRAQQQRLDGFGARATAAHYNCFEALACFAPAVLAVLAVDAVNQTAVLCAWLFVAARVAYIVCYWLNQDVLRSVSWVVAKAVMIVLFVQAF